MLPVIPRGSRATSQNPRITENNSPDAGLRNRRRDNAGDDPAADCGLCSIFLARLTPHPQSWPRSSRASGECRLRWMIAIMIFARSTLLPAIVAALLVATGAATAPADEADRVRSMVRDLRLRGFPRADQPYHDRGSGGPIRDRDGSRHSRPRQRICRSYEPLGGAWTAWVPIRLVPNSTAPTCAGTAWIGIIGSITVWMAR